MAELLSIMKWPLLVSFLLPWLLVYYGLHIVRRGIIFVDLAIAQVAALGHCLAVLLGHDPHDWHCYAWSLGFTMVGAAVFTLTRSADRRIPQEALIGIVYVVAAAGSLLILSHSTGGDEELRRTLIGEILLVRPVELWRAFGLFVVVGGLQFAFRQQFLSISFEPAHAAAEGTPIRLWDFLFYMLFGVVVTSFVHLGGVLLVFAYLIVPAVCANLLSNSLRLQMAIGWVTATLGSALGLYTSYRLDLPTGAAIVCALGGLLVVVATLKRLKYLTRQKAPSKTPEES